MPRSARAFGLLALVCSSCHEVLGIEDAQVDPTLGSSQPAELDDGGTPPPDSGTTPLALTTCELYCQTVTQTCTGQFAQYTTSEACLGVCSLLPEGTPGDTSDNTVSCRLQAAGQAPLEPSFYCPIAGPGGNGSCGTNCEALCTLVAGLCTGDDSGSGSDDDDVSDCPTSCAELDDEQTYTVAPEAELYQGKHVQCRLFHASNATQADTEQHCQHALGSSPCD